MTTASALLDRTVKEFRRTLVELGGQPGSTDEAAAIGRRAALVVLAGDTWERALGDLLTSSEARVLLGGVSREALRKRVASGSMIALRDDAGAVRYPRWQFDAASDSVFPVVKRLNGVFGDAGLDAWTLASFITTRQPELGDRTPAAAFSDEDPEPLLIAADRAAAELSR